MTDPDPGNLAAQSRERHDPEEKYRPLPWFISMLISAMAMWGAFYIHDMQSGLSSQYGDSRTRSALMPAGSAAGNGAAGAAAPAIDGGAIFAARCVACHQTTGLGIPGVFPPLAGSEWVLGSDKILVLIPLHGIIGSVQVKGATYAGAMPVFSTLSDAEIAAVLTYVRSQWGNAAPPVSAATVAAGREATKARVDSWSNGDEIKQAANY
jgi:mono/diheme cytochrome c family protein